MDAVEEIKSRLSIEDVIGQYVELKRAGRNLKALSPFTNERTPSFVVSPEKQIWHDFSSGKGGNMFSFVMEMEGLDFKGALELLARKAGIDLDQYSGKNSAEQSRRKERLFSALETAAKFYQVQFRNNQIALEYVLKNRRFSKKTALDFRLGYSPVNGSALTDYLIKNSYTQDEIKAAGLGVVRSGRLYDMFRGRLMIPLMDSFGRVVGFTARILNEDPKAPKYINTPQTILYDKSRHVFGLHMAKEAIRRSKYAVMVEGNLDVVASHQAGVTNVVATAGTALTAMQLKSLSRLAPDVRLAFDEDRAGQDATERAIPIASGIGVNLNIISIPAGKDPDDLIKKDPKIWQEVIEKSQPALDWLIKRYKSQLDLESAAGKRQFSDVIMKVVAQLADAVEKDHYVRQIAKLLGVGEEALRSKLIGPRPATLKRMANKPEVMDSRRVDLIKDQNHLLSIGLMLIGARSYLEDIQPEMLLEDTAQTVLAFLQKNPDFDGNLKDAKQLQKEADYVKILAVQFEELYGEVDTLELHYEAARLRTRIIENYVKLQKTRLAHELNDASREQTAKLLQEVKELDQLLNKTKEAG